MSRERFYKITILCLLLLNFGILGYLVFSRNSNSGHPPHDAPDKIIIERLKMDERQQDSFNELKHEHHSQIMELQEQSSEIHKALYTLLKTGNTRDAVKDSLLKLLQQNALEREQVTFDHFQKLRAVLRTEQQVKFDELVEEMSQRIMEVHRRHP